MMLDDGGGGGMSMPDFGDPRAVFGFLVTVTWLALMGRLNRIGKVGARSGGEPAEPMTAERAAVEKGLGVSTAGVPDESMALFARLYGDISSLRAELGLERTYADILTDHIDDLEEGVTAGRYPPFPDRPQRTGSTRA